MSQLQHRLPVGPKSTLRELIDYFIVDKDRDRPLGVTHRGSLRAVQKMPIARKVAASLTSDDFLEHCRWRKNPGDGKKGVGPSTVNGDIIFVRGVLWYAKMIWKIPGVSDEPLKEARPLLSHFKLIAKAKRRKRRPSRIEYEQLLQYFKRRDKGRSKYPCADILEFSIWSCRRVSEIFELRWSDINFEDRTCIVRNMKDPRNKDGNDHTFPLLGRAWEIVMKQRKRRVPGEDRIFPGNEKSFGQFYTEAKKKLGIEDLHFHDNRREGVCRMLDAGYSLPEVMLVTGHKDLNTLQIYISLNAKDLHLGPAARRQVDRTVQIKDIRRPSKRKVTSRASVWKVKRVKRRALRGGARR